MKRIYLDNAASTPVDDDIIEAMLPYFKENFGNAQSQHGIGRDSANAMSAARDELARFAGCKPQELYYASCGTEAGNFALKGVCSAYGKGHIAISSIEHPSLTESALDMQKLGFDVTFVNPDMYGVVSAEEIKNALRKDTVFCTVMAANNETGAIQPVEEIGKVCRERGVFFYTDCVQTAPYMPLPTEHCNGLGFSAHKFYGPKGAAAVYIRGGSKIQRLISGGMQERGLRGGTVNVAAFMGMAAAYKKSCRDMAENCNRTKAVRDYFIERVFEEIDGVTLNGKAENLLPSHANISFGGCDAQNMLFYLDLKGICVSTGAACSAGATAPSHVLLAMGRTAEEARSAIRFSFGKHNTQEEVDKVVAELKSAVEKIRHSR